MSVRECERASRGRAQQVLEASPASQKAHKLKALHAIADLRTPQALPALQSSALSALSTEYAAHLGEHFVPFVPPLPITKERAFLPSLHLTVVSAEGNIVSALALAARAAFADLQVPDTKVIAWAGDDDAADRSGFGALKDGAKGKGKGRARARGLDDWDLGDGTHHLDAREELPVLLALNLVQDSENTFLDPTPQEEAACPQRVLAWFRPNGNVCGIRTEGGLGIDAGRVRALLEQAQGLATAMAASLNADLPQ